MTGKYELIPMKQYLHSNFNLESPSDLYDELPLWSAPFGLKLLEHIEYKKNLTALDIGFGNGFPLTELDMRLAFMDSWIQLLPPEKTEQVIDAIESRLNEQSRILGGIKLSIPFVMINAVKN
jgi:hypothetical protein